MKTIYKYSVFKGSFQHDIPEDAFFMDVQLQGGLPVMWWCCSPDSPGYKHEFRVFGTGHAVPYVEEGLFYLATWQDGPFVWHLFEVMDDLPLEGDGSTAFGAIDGESPTDEMAENETLS